MSHYADAFDAEHERQRAIEKKKLEEALVDFQTFRQFQNGRCWSFSAIGCEDLFNRMIERIQSKLYLLK